MGIMMFSRIVKTFICKVAITALLSHPHSHVTTRLCLFNLSLLPACSPPTPFAPTKRLSWQGKSVRHAALSFLHTELLARLRFAAPTSLHVGILPDLDV